jgi:iron(III) transport system ATP-binding protein
VGQVEIATPANGATRGDKVRLYLRPEDRILGDTGPVDAMPNALRSTVRRVDFLGTYCLARVDVDGFAGQRMTIYLSLNQAHELGVKEGAALPFALRGERVRVFPSTAAA